MLTAQNNRVIQIEFCAAYVAVERCSAPGFTVLKTVALTGEGLDGEQGTVQSLSTVQPAEGGSLERCNRWGLMAPTPNAIA